MRHLISVTAFLAILATHVNAQTTPTTVILSPELRVAVPPSPPLAPTAGVAPATPNTFRLTAEAYLSPGFKVGPSASLVVNGGKIGSLVITNETFLPGRTFGEVLYLPAGTEIPFGSETRGGIVGIADAPKFGGLAAMVGGSVFPAGSPVSTTAVNTEVSALRAEFNTFRATPPAPQPAPANMATKDDLVALKGEVGGMISAAVTASELRTDAKLKTLRAEIAKDTDAKLEVLKKALGTSAAPSAVATVNVTNAGGTTSVVANSDWETYAIGGYSYGRRPSDGACFQLIKVSYDRGRTWNKLEWRPISALPSN